MGPVPQPEVPAGLLPPRQFEGQERPPGLERRPHTHELSRHVPASEERRLLRGNTGHALHLLRRQEVRIAASRRPGGGILYR